MRARLVGLAVVALVAGGSVAVGAGVPDFSAAGYGIHYDNRAPNRFVIHSRHSGFVGAVDDTQLITPANTPPTYASGWKTIDVTRFGVPVTAKAVYLTFQAAITKGGHDSTATVFAFARAPGAACCPGPPGYPAFPIDWNAEEGFVSQSAAQLAWTPARTWSQAMIPVVDGKFEFAGGFRRMPGLFPEGDAVGEAVYLNGWLARRARRRASLRALRRRAPGRRSSCRGRPAA